MFSPPKRRKTSETTSVDIEISESLIDHNETRSPGRPSFQSPTRSSLAKSHPEVFQRALSRSPSRQPASQETQNDRPEQSISRSFGLRDRKALRPSLSGTSSPLKPLRKSGHAPTLSPSKSPSGIQSLSKPPRRLSGKILPTDFAFGSPVRKLKPSSEQGPSNTPEVQLAPALGSAAMTEAGKMSEDLYGDNGVVDDDPSEPDLPPTPTQLGLEKAPDRPRGMLSSSPSTRHGKPTGRRTVDLFHGSPLKTLRLYPDADEDPIQDLPPDETSAHALEKRQTRQSLLLELERLKDEVSNLTRWAVEIESDANIEDDPKELDKFLALLTEESSHLNASVPLQAPVPISSLLATLLPFSINIPCPIRPTSPLPTNVFAPKATSQDPAYLTLFTPLSLRINASRTSASQNNTIRETHTLTFTAPSPFPPMLYYVSVIYETDPETQSLISLSVLSDADSKRRRVPEPLRQWINSRLSNPLLKLDVATICWGINRYWEVALARAQLWTRIERKYGNINLPRRGKVATTEFQPGVITPSELRILIPHFERSSMVVTSESSHNGAKVFLSNPLTMDEWTGEPQLRPELSVSVTGSSKKIDQEAKKLFYALLKQDGNSTPDIVGEGVHVGAVLRATEGVLSALFGVG